MLHLHTPALPVVRRLSSTPSPTAVRLTLRLHPARLPSPAVRCSAEDAGLSVSIAPPSAPLRSCKANAVCDNGLLLSLAALTTTVAFASLVVAAVPTLFAMRRTAIALTKLADTAREELPSTMTAVRLSGMELSDLTLELTDLSQEIADGVSKSAQAVQAAKAGVRQIGHLARQHTMSIIEERANLPEISLRPVVEGAAKKTSHAVGQAGKTLMGFISSVESNTNGTNGGPTQSKRLER